MVEVGRTELGNERGSAPLASERLNVTVALTKALGGGWTTAPGGT